MRKRLNAYVYGLCAQGDLCVRCTSFARERLIAYVVRLWRSRRLIAYGVRLLCSRRLIAYVVRLFAIKATYASGSERLIV